jgi:hypothetical protein
VEFGANHAIENARLPPTLRNVAEDGFQSSNQQGRASCGESGWHTAGGPAQQRQQQRCAFMQMQSHPPAEADGGGGIPSLLGAGEGMEHFTSHGAIPFPSLLGNSLPSKPKLTSTVSGNNKQATPMLPSHIHLSVQLQQQQNCC